MDIANGAKTLRVDTHKDCVKFVIQWMWSGGSDPVVNNAVLYPANHLGSLQVLNTFATRLGINALAERTTLDIDRITRNSEARIRQQAERKGEKEAYLAREAARAERAAKRAQWKAERDARQKQWEAERAQREAEFLATAECYNCHNFG